MWYTCFNLYPFSVLFGCNANGWIYMILQLYIERTEPPLNITEVHPIYRSVIWCDVGIAYRSFQMSHCVSIAMIFVSVIFACATLTAKMALSAKMCELHLLPKWRPTRVHKKSRTQFFGRVIHLVLSMICNVGLNFWRGSVELVSCTLVCRFFVSFYVYIKSRSFGELKWIVFSKLSSIFGRYFLYFVAIYLHFN